MRSSKITKTLLTILTSIFTATIVIAQTAYPNETSESLNGVDNARMSLTAQDVKSFKIAQAKMEGVTAGIRLQLVIETTHYCIASAEPEVRIIRANNKEIFVTISKEKRDDTVAKCEQGEELVRVLLPKNVNAPKDVKVYLVAPSEIPRMKSIPKFAN